MRLQGRIAIITGGGTGIGKAIALGFAKEGAKVVVAGRRLNLVEGTAEEIKSIGGEALAMSVDVTEVSEVQAMVRATLEKFTRIDILVNNAGIMIAAPLVEMTDQLWDMVLDTNLKGAFLCTREVAKEMLKQNGGKIINISSMRGTLGKGDRVHYCSSKGGLNMLTKATATALGKYHINVNAIAPGLIETETTLSHGASWDNPEYRREFGARIPLGRGGKPEDVAGAAIFLASHESDYITGCILPVDGGFTAT